LAVLAFINSIYKKMGESDEARIDFIRVLTEAEFLFPMKVTHPLRALLKSSLDLRLTRRKLGVEIESARKNMLPGSHNDVISLTDKEKELINWITEQEAKLSELFLDYLDFRNVK